MAADTEAGAMRVLIWGINYAPEPTGIGPFTTDLARHLSEAGHAVTVVCAFPYYPDWRKRPQDRGRWGRREADGAVRVERCGCYVPGRVTTLGRVVHELSFAAVSLLRVLRVGRADVGVVISPPLALGAVAWVASRLRGWPFVFHVQDLQPDAAVGLGMVKPGLMTRVAYGLEALAYRKAARVTGIADGMLRAFARKGVPPDRRGLFPNWIRGGVEPVPTAEERRKARSELGLPPEAFVAVYSGNMGMKQNLGLLVQAARRLRGPAGGREIVVVLSGGGAYRPMLEAELAREPVPGVRLLPLLDEGPFRALQRAADVGLITQAAGSGLFFFPSKLLTTLQLRLPVVAVADTESELARAVTEGGFGEVVGTDRPEDLARLLEALADDPGRLEGWREKTAWVARFERGRILGDFEADLRTLAREGRAAA